MPNFGEAPSTMQETFEELNKALEVLKQNPALIPDLSDRLHGLVNMLGYHSRERQGIDFLSNPAKVDITTCSAEGCEKSWRDELFRVEGSWLCEAHLPAREEGQIGFVGQRPTDDIYNRLLNKFGPGGLKLLAQITNERTQK